MNGVIDGLLEGYESGRVSRRELLLTLSAMVVGAGNVSAQRQDAAFSVRTLNHTTLFVSDVQRSVDFYQRLFGMPVQSRQENGVNLHVGPENQFLGIYRASATARPMLHHVCLGVDDFDAGRAVGTLEEHGVTTGRVRMRGETPELYFTDPDGLSIQLQDVSYCGGGGVLGDRC